MQKKQEVKWLLQVTSQLKPTSLALAKTDRIMQRNEQHRMNDLVEIVVREVAWKFEFPAVENSLLCTFDLIILS